MLSTEYATRRIKETAQLLDQKQETHLVPPLITIRPHYPARPCCTCHLIKRPQQAGYHSVESSRLPCAWRWR